MTQIHAQIIRNACKMEELQSTIESLLELIRNKTDIEDDNRLTYNVLKVLPEIVDALKKNRTELIRLQTETHMLQGFLAELGLTDID